REMDTARQLCDWKQTELAARACLSVDPLNGRATIALAEVLAIGGSATKATELLDRYDSEVGADSRKMALPISALRKRIAERYADGDVRRSEFPFAGRECE